ncbi:MAG: hypothetical protein HZC24_08425, partial [Rhodocyclales bacterium]|nr:hypothetical protein [Rhodocyclales bacterium]
GIVERHYHNVTRYASSTFLRMKLGAALERRQVAPQLFDNPEEARGRVLRPPS